MSTLTDDVARELLPILDRLLGALGEADGNVVRYFERIRRHFAYASDEEAIANGFMDLSTAAMVLDGSRLEPATVPLIDELLASAQQIAATLSASSEDPQ